MFQPNWFAIRVKSNFERHVSLGLRGRGVEDYAPFYRRLRNYNGRIREVQLPLFPGYVFGRFDPNDRSPVVTVPGIVNIVGIGKVPAPVDPAELDAVRALMDSQLGAEPWPFVQAGQRMRIEKGPLKGLEGIVIAVRKNYRVVASVTLLQRSVSVEIDPGWVRGLPGNASVPAFARVMRG